MPSNSKITSPNGNPQNKVHRLILVLGLSLFLSGISYTHSARAWWPAIFHPDNLPMLMDGCTVGAMAATAYQLWAVISASYHVCQVGLTYNQEYERQRLILEDPVERVMATYYHPELWEGSESEVLIKKLYEQNPYPFQVADTIGEKNYRMLIASTPSLREAAENMARHTPADAFFVDNRAQQRARVEEMWSGGYTIGSNLFYAAVVEVFRRQFIRAYHYVNGLLPSLRNRYRGARRRPFPASLRDQINALRAAAREAERDRERTRERGRRGRRLEAPEQQVQQIPGLQTNPFAAAAALPSVIATRARDNLRRFYNPGRAGARREANNADQAQAAANRHGVVLVGQQVRQPAAPNIILPLPGIEDVRTGKQLANFINDTDGLVFEPARNRGRSKHPARITIRGAPNVPLPGHYANVLRNLRPDQVRYCIRDIKRNCGYF